MLAPMRSIRPSTPPRLACTALAALLASCLSPALRAQVPDARQLALFAANCAQCHARADTGAPLAGDAKAWAARLADGEDAVLQRAVVGVRGMPPLGYCGACTEADLRTLTRFMAGTSGATP